MVKKIAIIGGGAAGMMAMATLVESDFLGEVHLFEKNSSLGAKVVISGGGRCNVTTGYYKRKELESKYIRGSLWLREVIGKFGPRKIYQWFENHGVPLKTESDMRVFPISDNGKDIVGVFERLLQSKKTNIHYKMGIDKISYCNKQFELITNKGKSHFDAVIIATGGNAYSHTGSTGDAYERARSLGHTVNRLGPSLNSFLSKDKWTYELSGIAFQKAKLEVLVGGKRYESIGPMLLTHFGLTGPAIFIIAAYTAFEVIDGNHPIKISLSIDSEKNSIDRHDVLLQETKKNPRKQISTILKQYVPDRVIDAWNKHVFGNVLGQEIGLMNKVLRGQIVEMLTGRVFEVIGRRPGDEFVTAGGVSLDEVDPKTMMSKIIPGLFFAGEVLDVDGVTGGYNLTSSWATGRLAGEESCKLLNN